MDIAFFSSDEFIAGGLIVSLFAASISIIWEGYRRRCESKLADDAAWESLRGLMSYNISIIKINADSLRAELTALKSGSSDVMPISAFIVDLNLLLAKGIPRKVNRNKMINRQLRDVVIQMKRANDIIDSRERYKISCQDMPNYHRRIGIYDTAILECLDTIDRTLGDLIPVFEGIE